MSTNIKLLIALLLGAAIGALVMKKTGWNDNDRVINEIIYGPGIPDKDLTLLPDTFDAASNMKTSSIDFSDAKKYVQDYQRKAMLWDNAPEVHIRYQSRIDTALLESVVIEKEKLLVLLGIQKYTDVYPKIRGVRCYLGENDKFTPFENDTKYFYQGNTIVCIPTDSAGNNIIGAPTNTYYEALEYHLPCPKHCKSNAESELSLPELTYERPRY